MMTWVEDDIGKGKVPDGLEEQLDRMRKRSVHSTKREIRLEDCEWREIYSELDLGGPVGTPHSTNRTPVLAVLDAALEYALTSATNI